MQRLNWKESRDKLGKKQRLNLVRMRSIKNYWVERSWDPKPEIVLNKNSYNSWARKINKELGERGFGKHLLSEDSYQDYFGKIYGFNFRLHIWDEAVSRSEYGYSEKYSGGDIVDQIFYELLKVLYRKEVAHFNSVDPKMVKIAECRNLQTVRLPYLTTQQ